MSDLVRFTVSLDGALFEQLESEVKGHDYRNRSEFIRDLIRNHMVEREWLTDETLLGTISLLYDHHTRGLTERLTDQQHHFVGTVLATTHVHLDSHRCAEMIMVRGKGSDIQALTDRLQREKGVLHAKLATSSIGHHL